MSSEWKKQVTLDDQLLEVLEKGLFFIEKIIVADFEF
jgi:hypothetical protein